MSLAIVRTEERLPTRARCLAWPGHDRVSGRTWDGEREVSDTLPSGFSHDTTTNEEHTARRVFTTLPLGRRFAHRLVPAMATGLLVSTIEAACILEMQPYLGSDETVVGTDVAIHHIAPAIPEQSLRISGEGHRCGDREWHFDVTVDDACETVATARVTLVVVQASRFAARLAEKKRAAVRCGSLSSLDCRRGSARPVSLVAKVPAHSCE